MFFRDTDITIDGIEFSIHSDLVNGGFNEDGEMVVNESYSVIATYENGERFLHHARFVQEHYGQEARERAIYLLGRVANSDRVINPKTSEHWCRTFSVYGSAAYDESETVEWERRCDEEDQMRRFGM